MRVLMGMQGLSAAAEPREDPKAKTLLLLASVEPRLGTSMTKNSINCYPQ